MTVYIEYVLIDNFTIDYMLLKATFAITGFPYSKRRLFLCSLVGSVFALFYPLLPIKGIILTAIKILFGLLLCFVACKFNTGKKCYITAVVFFILTFLCGGSIYGLMYIFNIRQTNEIITALIFLPVYFVIRIITGLFKFFYKQRDIKSFKAKVEISILGKVYIGEGFFDTGNGLYDGQNPVVVCSKKFAQKIIAKAGKLPEIRRLDVETVAGNSKMLAVKISSIKIYYSDKENIFNNVTMCVSKGSVGTGLDIILHPALMEEINAKNNSEQVKKAS